MTKTLETRTDSQGRKVRLQQRGSKFDVTYNSTGYAWRYLVKGVSEETARFEFELRSLVNV